MKIALFYPNNFLAGWYSQGGYVKTLKAMGHEVLDGGLPGNQPHDIEHVRTVVPTLEELATCDVVLSMYHEYVTPWYNQLFKFEDWEQLRGKVPIIGRFDESFDRLDLALAHRWEEMKRWASLFSFPAQQDASLFKGQWMPFGSDTTIFTPLADGVTITKYGTPEKKYQVAFIGSMYPIRQNYLQRLAEHLPNTITFSVNSVVVQDLGGIRSAETVRLLAENYRQIKIFFCLPPMSRLIVAKVPDIMACGTFVMYPKLPHHARMNMNQYRHKEHIIYYDPGYLGQNAKQILYYLENEEEREKIAAAGCKHTHDKCTLVHMLQNILDLRQEFNQATVTEIKQEEAAAAG
jgi:hypothetical protein